MHRCHPKKIVCVARMWGIFPSVIETSDFECYVVYNYQNGCDKRIRANQKSKKKKFHICPFKPLGNTEQHEFLEATKTNTALLLKCAKSLSVLFLLSLSISLMSWPFIMFCSRLVIEQLTVFIHSFPRKRNKNKCFFFELDYTDLLFSENVFALLSISLVSTLYTKRILNKKAYHFTNYI